MNPIVKYSLARLALFVVVSAIVLALPVAVHPLIKLGAALLLSAAFAWFLLRGMREEVAQRLANAADRRSESKRRLRAALAGDDDERQPAH
jgi:hypothetical protein